MSEQNGLSEGASRVDAAVQLLRYDWESSKSDDDVLEFLREHRHEITDALRHPRSVDECREQVEAVAGTEGCDWNTTLGTIRRHRQSDENGVAQIWRDAIVANVEGIKSMLDNAVSHNNEIASLREELTRRSALDAEVVRVLRACRRQSLFDSTKQEIAALLSKLGGTANAN